MFRRRPPAKVSEQSCERGGLIVSVKAAGVRQNPGVAAAEKLLLKTDVSIFVSGDNSERPNPDDGDDRRPPTFDFGCKPLAARAKFVVGQLFCSSRGAPHDIGDAELKIENEIAFKRREKPRRKPAIMKSRPEPIAGSTEVPANRGRIQARIDASEQNDKIFRD